MLRFAGVIAALDHGIDDVCKHIPRQKRAAVSEVHNKPFIPQHDAVRDFTLVIAFAVLTERRFSLLGFLRPVGVFRLVGQKRPKRRVKLLRIKVFTRQDVFVRVWNTPV